MHQRFQLFDAYRGILALIVATMHSDINATLLPIVFYGGYLAVDFFFILSGFVLSYRYWHEIETGCITLRAFLRQRIARLYPLHLFTLLVSILVIAFIEYYQPFIEWPYISLWSNFLALFLSHNIGLSNIVSLNNPSWSISVEIYVNILLFLIIFKYFRAMWLFLALACISYAILYFEYGTLLVQIDRAFNVLNAGLLRGIGGISLGCCCYCFYQKRLSDELVSRSALLSSLLEIACFAVVIYLLLHSRMASNFFLPLAAACLIYLGAFEKGILRKLLVNPPLLFLGKLSYSIYLNHKIVWIVLTAMKNGNILVLPAFAQQMLGFLLIIFFSYITYHLIELPMMKALSTRK